MVPKAILVPLDMDPLVQPVLTVPLLVPLAQQVLLDYKGVLVPLDQWAVRATQDPLDALAQLVLKALA